MIKQTKMLNSVTKTRHTRKEIRSLNRPKSETQKERQSVSVSGFWCGNGIYSFDSVMEFFFVAQELWWNSSKASKLSDRRIALVILAQKKAKKT